MGNAFKKAMPNVRPKVQPSVKVKKPDVKKPDVKKPSVSKKGLAAGAVVAAGAAVVVATAVGGAQKQICVDEWKKGYPEHWEGDEKRTLEALLKKTKTGDAETVAKYQKAYFALEDCDKHDVVGNAIETIGESVVAPISGLAGGALGNILGPIAEALEPVKWVLIALLCALAVGAAYKAYTVLLARRAVSTPLDAPTSGFEFGRPRRT